MMETFFVPHFVAGLPVDFPSISVNQANLGSLAAPLWVGGLRLDLADPSS